MPQPKLVEVPDAANAAGYDGYMKGNARSNACAPLCLVLMIRAHD
jgi:hypothetical protein